MTDPMDVETYRSEHMQQVIRQTKALELIRSYVGWLLGLVVVGIVAGVIVVANS